MKKYILLVMLLFVTYNSYSNEYVIQLETVHVFTEKDSDQLSMHGNVSGSKVDTGKTLTLLGPFSNKQIATEALHELQIVGYKNAFITKHSEETRSSGHIRNIKYRYNKNPVDVNTLLDEDTLKKWNSLTPDQRSSLVYQEGVLLVKSGANFIPFTNL